MQLFLKPILVLAILRLIQIFEKANFNLYCQSLTELIPFLFAMNNLNYEHYTPVFCKDYDLTETTSDGSDVLYWNVIVHKSSRQFSPIILVRTVERSRQGWWWSMWCDWRSCRTQKMMVIGPEVRCLITQYETACTTKEGTEDAMQPSWAPSHQGAQGHFKNMPHLMFSPQYRHTLPSTIEQTLSSPYTGQIVCKLKPSQLKRRR